jgi:hypothetical protein
MVARLEKTQGGYTISLTAEMVEELHIGDGAAVQVLPMPEVVEESRPQIRYASAEEVMAAHREMEPYHAVAYSELAK